MFNSRTTLFASILIGFVVTAAHAQASRTHVSGVGDDANSCSRTAPCRTFAGAISKTAMGGEINTLDSAGFGTVTISKSITIDGTGTQAGVLGANAANGILINITSSNDTAKSVRLRGLSFNGLGTSANGINVTAATDVSIEDSVIDGFDTGINVTQGDVFVRNTTIRNNRGTGINNGRGKVGLVDVSLAFNATATKGPGIQSLGNVFLFGNGA